MTTARPNSAPAAIGVDPQLEAGRCAAQEVLHARPQLRPHLRQQQGISVQEYAHLFGV